MTSQLEIYFNNGVDTPIDIVLQLSKPQGSVYSPTPKMLKITRKRAIAKHEIPNAEFDVGQDMGQFAVVVDIQGRSMQDVTDDLDAIMDCTQFNSSTGKGAIRLSYQGEAATGGSPYYRNEQQSFSDYYFVMKQCSHDFEPGTILWWNYSLQFEQFGVQSL